MAFSRREFLVGAAGAGIGFGLGTFSHQLPLAPPEVGPDWRPGAETFVNSTCLLCPAHCGIRARRIDGIVSRIDGNPMHPLSQGGLCAKGRAGIQLLYHPGRLKGPIERIGPPGSDEFQSISWESALERVAAALTKAQSAGRAQSVEWLLGDVGGVRGELVHGFCEAYGTERITVDDYRDGSAEVLRLCQGINAPPAYDLANADLVLSFGAGLSESWRGLPQAARARNPAEGSGPRWVQIDARHSRTAARADQWLPVRPGHYGTLALGLAYTILKEGLYDIETMARMVDGLDPWTDEHGTEHAGYKSLVLRHGRPEDVSAKTGIPAMDIIALGKRIGAADRPVAVWDQAVSWRRGGLADALAIHALNILSGSLNRSGGVLVQAPLPAPSLFPGRARADLDDVRLASPSWPAAASTPDVLFMLQANPVASSPEPDRVRRYLGDTPFVVSFSPFFDESVRHSDIVLPDHTYLERWQDATAPSTVAYPIWSVVQPVVEPLQDTVATGDVILKLAERLGGEVASACHWPSERKMVEQRGLTLAAAKRGSAFVPSFERQELRELEQRGWWLPHRRSNAKYWASIRDAGGWFDPMFDYHDRSAISQRPDGRVWVFPAEARRQLEESDLGLIAGFLPGTEQAPSELQRGYPLTMIPFRVMTLASGSTALMPWLLENLGMLVGDAWGAWVEINPETARVHGIDHGQSILVESAEGSFEARARLFAGAQPGVVNVPYGLHTHVSGWGEAKLANPLAAVGGAVDPVSGLPDWYSTSVRVKPA